MTEQELREQVMLAAFEDELEKIAGLPRHLRKKLTARTVPDDVPTADFSTSSTSYGLRRMAAHTEGKRRAKRIAKARKKGGILGNVEAKLRQLAARRGAGEKTVEMSVPEMPPQPPAQ